MVTTVVEFLLEEPFLLLGILLVSGYVASFLLQRVGIPHIVTFLLTGFILASTVLADVDLEQQLGDWFIISENFALGLIGFKIGTELKYKILSKEPKFISIILLTEAGGAFLVVFTLVFAYSHDTLTAILLAGLATATAPAATVEVLRKLKAAGPLTTRIQWILAFDDVVAICVVESTLIYLEIALGGDSSLLGIFHAIEHELLYAIIIGLVLGMLLDLIIERQNDDLEMMEITLSFLVLAIGIAHWVHTSVITATMIIGAVATNRGGDNYEKSSDLLELIMSPIVMVFFVLVGARITFDDFSPFPMLALVYLIARTIGKIGGAYFGATQLNAEPKLKNNLGFGLLAQGGVALGLVSVANDILIAGGRPEFGHLLVSTLIISTVFSEALGSFGTIFAIRRSGEDGQAEIKDRMKHNLNPEPWEYKDQPSRYPFE